VEQGLGLPEVSGRVLVAAQPQVDNAEPGQREGLALTIADRAEQVQGLPVGIGRLLVVALLMPATPSAPSARASPKRSPMSRRMATASC